ncbi:L-serine dehydratase 1 [Enhygromyxa salina]|uniref:L-serine dehydratase n=1 Tax=Enhygromyxa salina TaxID=215803 RepID=A0A2S9YKV1_9BACT|nr:L-serine ammonia-lyase [Enhygromyxa salina]PRQ05740.1 L-serine dehydratase 1 [Enhygromyxa salina]
MAISIFDMFTIGIGPSSSHTVGPMKAARRFVLGLERDGTLARVAKLRVELFGSLGHTGKGHGSDTAVLLGLEGERPETVEVDEIAERVANIENTRQLRVLEDHAIPFDPKRDVVFHRRQILPLHPNGMRFWAHDAAGVEIRERTYYSVGGGFVVDDQLADEDRIVADDTPLPHPFDSGTELLERCRESGLSISTLTRENEAVWRSEAEIRERLGLLWSTMQACVERGCAREGILPGGLRVKRRAAAMYRRLRNDPSGEASSDPLRAMDWVNLYALAVNEENAAGGRVVTAPTNGAAGIIPAVLHFYRRFYAAADREGIERFLLTAGSIGIIYKTRASISGAEVGCQGEVGVACSMAAAGLTEALGGTPSQVECAAEIGMEHNLGLTCDPVGGLVQVPCIERNAMGAVKAINAARLAMRGDGSQKVSLDKVIETMRQTGADMKKKYKETARGGLAVNIIEC